MIDIQCNKNKIILLGSFLKISLITFSMHVRIDFKNRRVILFSIIKILAAAPGLDGESYGPDVIGERERTHGAGYDEGLVTTLVDPRNYR